MHPPSFNFSTLKARLRKSRAAGAASCHSLSELRFPNGSGLTVVKGELFRNQRACWKLHIETGKWLELRLTSTGSEVVVEVQSASEHPAGIQSRQGVSVNAWTNGLSLQSSAGSSETRMSIGPQQLAGELLIALTTAHGAPASYRMELTLR
jgi:hypothetical protein